MVLEDLLSQLDVDRVTRHVEWLTNETEAVAKRIDVAQRMS